MPTFLQVTLSIFGCFALLCSIVALWAYFDEAALPYDAWNPPTEIQRLQKQLREQFYFVNCMIFAGLALLSYIGFHVTRAKVQVKDGQ